MERNNQVLPPIQPAPQGDALNPAYLTSEPHLQAETSAAVGPRPSTHMPVTYYPHFHYPYYQHYQQHTIFPDSYPSNLNQ